MVHASTRLLLEQLLLQGITLGTCSYLLTFHTSWSLPADAFGYACLTHLIPYALPTMFLLIPLFKKIKLKALFPTCSSRTRFFTRKHQDSTSQKLRIPKSGRKAAAQICDVEQSKERGES